jgi:hypothetical protein
MQKLEPEARIALRHAVSEVRESLFVVADDTKRLIGCPDLQGFLQTASFNLGEAECELTALLGAPRPVSP